MQLGTRWRFGADAPSSLTADVRRVIGQVESSVGDTAADAMWTLTWLEGRPVAELGFETEDGYPTVTVDPITGEPSTAFQP